MITQEILSKIFIGPDATIPGILGVGAVMAAAKGEVSASPVV